MVAVEHKITVVQMVHMVVAVEVQEQLVKALMVELVLVLGIQAAAAVLPKLVEVTHLQVVQDYLAQF